uniref:Uncharacterized protein n=1 Tax=Anguilla anguilla TaxID=7936 RepID=A0A0E9VP82_ANGAN
MTEYAITLPLASLNRLMTPWIASWLPLRSIRIWARPIIRFKFLDHAQGDVLKCGETLWHDQ